MGSRPGEPLDLLLNEQVVFAGNDVVNAVCVGWHVFAGFRAGCHQGIESSFKGPKALIGLSVGAL
jgi:hypothetical protein